MEKNKKYVRFQYSEKDLEDACRDVVSGTLSLNKAHKHYNIPKSTLHNKINQKVPMQRKLGPCTQLTQAEENELSKWIIKKAKSGFPMHPEELQLTVKKYLDSNDRKSTFIDNKPGRKWLQLFLTRHPEISKRNAEVISRARASVSETSIRKWFEELNNFLKENEADDVMNHPERIFNADETGVQMCPKFGAVLAPKNYKNSYQIATGKEKEQVTVLCNVSANGESAPPMLVYPYKRIPRVINDSVPDEWGIGRSDSGWMISETFLNYVKNVFHPWLIQNNIALPVIMFLDGHKSHINKELFEYCTENKILLYCLFPNATHILQPCDVSFFKSLKNAWKDAVRNFKAENPTKVLNRSNFASVFKIAYNSSISKTEVISNGFRKCGLYPLDPNSVDYTKCVTSHQVAGEQVTGTDAGNADVQTVQPDVLCDSDVHSTIKVIEHLTTDSVIEEFNASRDENKSHDHPYFSLWLFCKTYLASKDLTVPLTNVCSVIDHHNVLSETGNCPETNVTGFDAIFDGINSPMDRNITGLELEAILNDENLTFEFREDNSVITNNEPIQKSDATITESHGNAMIAGSSASDSDVTNASFHEEQMANDVENDPSLLNTDEVITKSRDDVSVNVSINKESKTAQGIETFLTIPILNKKTQKRKTTIMPYGITSSKMKDYFNEQDAKKKEKEENIQRKKALRLEKVLKKEANIQRKKALRLEKVLKKEAKETVLRKKNRQPNKPKLEITTYKETEENGVDSIILNNDGVDFETSKELRKNSTIDKNDLTSETKPTKWEATEVNNKQICSGTKVKFSDVSFDSYVLVKFEEARSTKLFAGKVLMVNDDEKKIKVDFLRKKRQKSTECELFVYPQVKDVYEIHIESVVDILIVKDTTRRGEIIFTKDLKNVQ